MDKYKVWVSWNKAEKRWWKTTQKPAWHWGQIRKECLTEDEALRRYQQKYVDSKYRQQNAGKPDKGKQTYLSSFHIQTLGNPWQVWQISVQGVLTYKWQVRSVVRHWDIWSVSCQQLDSKLGIMWNMWLPDGGTEGDTSVMRSKNTSCEAEKFPDSGRSDCACVLFQFLVVRTYSLNFRGI